MEDTRDLARIDSELQEKQRTNQDLESSSSSDNILLVESEETQSHGSAIELKPEERPKGEPTQEWATIASFTLEFQSRVVADRQDQQVIVQYIEGDQEKVWTALDDDTIYPWVLNRVNNALEKLPKNQQPEVAPSIIEITQIRFLQPLHAVTAMVVDEANSLLRDALRSSDPIALEVTFKLAGLDVAELIQQALPYQIQGKFHNRVTGANIPIGSNQSSHLIEDQRSYTIRLPEVQLAPGPYQLQIVATLHHASVPPALFEIPILQVV